MDPNLKKTEGNDEKDKEAKKGDEDQPKPDDCKEKTEKPESTAADESLKVKVFTAKDLPPPQFKVADVEAAVNSANRSAPTSPSGSPSKPPKYSTVTAPPRTSSPLSPPKLNFGITAAARKLSLADDGKKKLTTLQLDPRPDVEGRKSPIRSPTNFPTVAEEKTPDSSPEGEPPKPALPVRPIPTVPKPKSPVKPPLFTKISEESTQSESSTPERELPPASTEEPQDPRENREEPQDPRENREEPQDPRENREEPQDPRENREEPQDPEEERKEPEGSEK